MPASFVKRNAFVMRKARPLIFFSVLILLGAAISRLAASGSSPTLPPPEPHDQAEAARAGQLAGPAPSGPAPNSPTARQFAAVSGPPGPGAQPQVPWATSRVFATRYDPNTAGSVEVAVPDKCVKFAALGDTATLSNFHCGSGYPVGLDYRVLITRDNGQSMYIPVRDVGPWNIDDNYWDPADSSYPRPRRLLRLPGRIPRRRARGVGQRRRRQQHRHRCRRRWRAGGGHLPVQRCRRRGLLRVRAELQRRVVRGGRQRRRRLRGRDRDRC